MEKTIQVQMSTSTEPLYKEYLKHLQTRFSNASANETLFITDATGLWDLYLNTIPEEHRQHYNCRCCRRFIEAYGSVACLEDGLLYSPLWHTDIAPPELQRAIAAMRQVVESAKILSPFVHSEADWGIYQNHSKKHDHDWNHLYVRVTPNHTSRVKTPFEIMASKVQDFQNLQYAMTDFSREQVDAAVKLLASDTMAGSEKVLGGAEFLQRLHHIRTTYKGREQYNRLWGAIACAPDGFCHPRSGMLGTVLEDIKAGLSFDTISAKFAKKMDGLAYMRPKAAPSEGTIKQAEELVAKLGVAESLKRRVARLDEVVALWKPVPAVPAASSDGSVFGHLKPKTEPVEVALPRQTMTWDKFFFRVLPYAKQIEIRTPSIGSFCALTTAQDPNAPNLFQWSNTFSFYTYAGGSRRIDWLLNGDWQRVSMICRNPEKWDDNFPNHKESTVFLIEGARETRTGQGNALFPSDLRSEFHGIRAVVEAYSKTAVLGGTAEGSACGMVFSDTFNILLKVDGAEYMIDRRD